MQVLGLIRKQKQSDSNLPKQISSSHTLGPLYSIFFWILRYSAE